MRTNDLDLIKMLIKESKKTVFFGGAGVSTASGIPDFRGADGLYNVVAEYGVQPEVILSNSYLYAYPERFYKYYRENMLYPGAKPNGAHTALSELERRGELSCVITQNIDGLHQAAGSQNVIELHGSVLRNYCSDCGKRYAFPDVLESDGVPRCKLCGAFIRPDVTLYGEALDNQAFMMAEEACATADVLIVGGTSLTVNPAASLVRLYRKGHLIIINKSPTPYDSYAEFVIREPIEEVLSYIVCGD